MNWQTVHIAFEQELDHNSPPISIVWCIAPSYIWSFIGYKTEWSYCGTLVKLFYGFIGGVKVGSLSL